MNETSIQRQARLFHALSHPARLAILDLLRDSEACVCHLEAHLGYRQAYISQQLAALRAAGLVLDRREGWNVYYRIAQPELFVLLDAGLRMVGGATDRDRLPERLPDCVCPKCTPSIALAGAERFL